MIPRGAVELVQELLKEKQEGTEISHFMRRTEKRTREKILLMWLSGRLQSGSLTSKELEEKFKADLCEQIPKILILSGMGYRPESGADVHHYLKVFVEQKKTRD
jgi:hypothetical protein